MPTMKPTLLLDFANSRQLGPLVTFTRASTTWRMGRRGLLESVPSGAPAFDHDPVTLACLGLGIWESRTNLLLHSRDLTNAAWVTTAGTGTETKDATGADGVANAATRLTATSANYTLIQSITSASASRATTAYVRRITGTGTVEFTADNGTTWTPITLTSSYARVAAPVATITNPAVGFRIVTSGDEIAVDFVQCETGALATPPIDTAGSQVTRAADAAVISGAAFSSWLNSAQSTICADWRNSTSAIPSGATQIVLDISDGTTNNFYRIFQASSAGTKASANTFSGGVNAGRIDSGGSYSSARVKAALAVASLDRALSANGQSPATSSVGALPVGVTQMHIGRGADGAGHLNGWIERISIYPARLSNADLQALTAP